MYYVCLDTGKTFLGNIQFILGRRLRSKNQVSYARDIAKDLINESSRLFETLGNSLRVAAARIELGFCYWLAGALDEARIHAHRSSAKTDDRRKHASTMGI